MTDTGCGDVPLWHSHQHKPMMMSFEYHPQVGKGWFASPGPTAAVEFIYGEEEWDGREQARKKKPKEWMLELTS